MHTRNIRKNLFNANSPIITNQSHKRESLKGQFSFAKAPIGPGKNSDIGIEYQTNGEPGDGSSQGGSGGSSS